jgi:hypothetical protein
VSREISGTLARASSRGEGGLGPETARIFNSALGAAAVSALFELGLFDELQQKQTVGLREFCERRNLHRASLLALLDVLHRSGVVELSRGEDVARPGPAFAQAYRDKGYFLWLVRGYGNMLENLATLLRNENRTGDFIRRDGRYIAMAGRDYGSQFVDPGFTEVLRQMPFRVAADIGCGSAERLIKLANQRPDFRGIGIDINAGSISVARAAVAAAGLQDRITLVHADVKELEPQPELGAVEVIFSFFMGHDLWPRANCLQSLRRIRAGFPRVKRFLLCDTYRSDLPLSEEAPIFTLGFEVTHAVMGQYIPSVAEWMDLFEEAGWACVGQREVDIPFSAIFDLRPRTEAG